MRVYTYAFLLLTAATFPCGVVQADDIDSQTDDSTYGVPSPAGPAFYVTIGYVPSRAFNLSGVRFRISNNASSTYACPADRKINILEFSGTSTPDSQAGAVSAGSLFNLNGTTTPDADGNCDYSLLDSHDRNPYVPVSPSRFYLFLIDQGWMSGQFVSFKGAPAVSTATSLFGYRVAFGSGLTWGTTGLESPYYEMHDAPPPFIVLPPPPPSDPCAGGGCVSNVLFLPGIEGSRLYEGTGCGSSEEEKLWEPLADSVIRILRGAGDDKVKKLFLDSTGRSQCGDIYVKAGDIIDSVGGSDVYKSFIGEMDALQAAGTINAWGAVPYDWRLSLEDLLTKGAEHDGEVFYGEATDTPYIEQSLRALASSSKTHKVTLIAHSNGGLVAKALLQKLGDAAAESLVDKVILVGSPQGGAPAALGAALYGYDQGISFYGVPILRAAVARELALDSPMAYHLLPSSAYLSSIWEDAVHPVGRFVGEAYAKEEEAYGPSINSLDELDSFLTAQEEGRTDPEPSNVKEAAVLNQSLIDYANNQHDLLDAWTAPPSIEVDQIAGWGVDTVAGIDFYTSPKGKRLYRPIFTEDGDGTVPIPSALLMSSSPNTKQYWLDLSTYYKNTRIRRIHKDLFEIPSFQDFIKQLLQGSSGTLPDYISTTQPPPNSEGKKLIFLLHSPLTLQLTNSSGNVTGLAPDGSIDQSIPGSEYGEFGEVKYVSAPEDGEYTLAMQGQDIGDFSLDIEEVLGGEVVASSSIAEVPTTPTTLVNLTIAGGLDTVSALSVDSDGDGTGDISLTPKIGQTILYEPPSVPVAEPQTSNAPIVSPGSISIPIVTSSTSTLGSRPILETIATSAPISATPIQTADDATAEISTPRNTGVSQKESHNVQERILPKPYLPPPQTASVYGVSQQPLLSRVGKAVYNELHALWFLFVKTFLAYEI